VVKGSVPIDIEQHVTLMASEALLKTSPNLCTGSHGVLNAARSVRKNLDMHVGQGIWDADIARREQEAESTTQEPSLIQPALPVDI
jgi:hypothetical protein